MRDGREDLSVLSEDSGGEDLEEHAGAGVDSVFEMYYCWSSRTWRRWMESLPDSALALPAGASFSELIVPTADSTRASRLLTSLVARGYHCVLAGASGTGKSQTASAFLMQLPHDKFVPLCLAFSAQTSAAATQVREREK